MEITTKELGAIEQVAGVANGDAVMKELVELELSLIGGGQGDVSFG